MSWKTYFGIVFCCFGMIAALSEHALAVGAVMIVVGAAMLASVVRSLHDAIKNKKS